ncbi:MAG: hypothetical protein UY95_C0019G0010 [Parcubacteria group bacterium GW2011_GWA2_56_7]|nr:MAG: hypothetical protein UY95_C0019G0010 [Parcubacteria group bacterium GW2011_GWA2_56_7]
MSAQKLIGFGLGLALLAMFGLGSIALSASSTSSTTYVPLTSDDLLEVAPGTSIGDVAGLGTADLRTTVAQIIRAILAFLGVVAVVIIIWGGFKWMTSGGADDKGTAARKLIIMGIVGLAIVLSAYAIASFVISSLISATT